MGIHSGVNNFVRDGASFAKQRLSYILGNNAGSECADARDKVYGLPSLVRSSRVIHVDFSLTPVDVFYTTVRKIVQDETLMNLNSHVHMCWF